MLVSAHAWPGWDSWVIPFFVYALLLVSLDWWFCAGVVLALGALCKGQQLLVAPLFMLGVMSIVMTKGVGLLFTTVPGWAILTVAAVLSGAGVYFANRITRSEV